jgi:hypothetical protein
MDKVQKPSDSACLHHRQNPLYILLKGWFFHNGLEIENIKAMFNLFCYLSDKCNNSIHVIKEKSTNCLKTTFCSMFYIRFFLNTLDYYHLPECHVLQSSRSLPTFQRKVLPCSSGRNSRLILLNHHSKPLSDICDPYFNSPYHEAFWGSNICNLCNVSQQLSSVTTYDRDISHRLLHSHHHVSFKAGTIGQ